MPTSIAGKPRNNSQRGFTYVMVLVAVIVLGIISGAASLYSSRASQMDREAELLFRGMAYRNAIRDYYESGNPRKTFPRSLDELVRDPRTGANKSYLRKLYKDPMSKGKGEWTLIHAMDGGIAGVASTSTDAPLKTGNFRAGLEKFENAKSYAEWVFEYVPEPVPGAAPQHP